MCLGFWSTRFSLSDVFSGMELFCCSCPLQLGCRQACAVGAMPFRDAMVNVGGSLCCLSPPDSYVLPLVFEKPWDR